MPTLKKYVNDRNIAYLSTNESKIYKKIANIKTCRLKRRGSKVLLSNLPPIANVFSGQNSLNCFFFSKFDGAILEIDENSLENGLIIALQMLDFTNNFVIMMPKNVNNELIKNLESSLSVPIFKKTSSLIFPRTIDENIDRLFNFELENKISPLCFPNEIENAIDSIKGCLKENLAFLFPMRFVAIELLLNRQNRVSILKKYYKNCFDEIKLSKSVKEAYKNLKNYKISRKKLLKIYENTYENKARELLNKI